MGHDDPRERKVRRADMTCFFFLNTHTVCRGFRVCHGLLGTASRWGCWLKRINAWVPAQIC